jgi:hypothetical protein
MLLKKRCDMELNDDLTFSTSKCNLTQGLSHHWRASAVSVPRILILATATPTLGISPLSDAVIIRIFSFRKEQRVRAHGVGGS